MIPDAYLKTVFNIWGERGEKTTCSISGNCMAPMIRDGDSLVIEHGTQEICVGDVVVFGTPGKFYAHRVVHIEDGSGRESFVLKGDKSSTFDRPISRGQILGKVIAVQGPNGHLYFNSIFWRVLNYILAIRSYVCGRRLRADSAFWKGVNYLFVLRSRIFPRRYSINLILWRGICRAYKTGLHMQTFYMSKKKRCG